MIIDADIQIRIGIDPLPMYLNGRRAAVVPPLLPVPPQGIGAARSSSRDRCLQWLRRCLRAHGPPRARPSCWRHRRSGRPCGSHARVPDSARNMPPVCPYGRSGYIAPDRCSPLSAPRGRRRREPQLKTSHPAPSLRLHGTGPTIPTSPIPRRTRETDGGILRRHRATELPGARVITDDGHRHRKGLLFCLSRYGPSPPTRCVAGAAL